ncbi:MAG: hypothetical protein Fur005_20590 [Roseiflexaceae bacterium]
MADDVQLSEREREILKLVATGASNQQIATDLGISINTVKVHLRNIFGKIGANSRTEATMYAVRSGMVDVGAAATAPEAAKPSPPSAPVVPPSTAAATPPTNKRNPTILIGSIVGTAVGILLIVLLFNLSNQNNTPAAAPTSSTPAAPPAVNWIARRDAPISLIGAAATNVGGRIYLIGGATSAGISTKAFQYDPANDSWASVPDKPTAVKNIAAVRVGSKIYVPGGELSDGTISSNLEIYDTATQTWQQGAALPSPRSAYGLAAVDGRIYLFGGWNGQAATVDTFMYDPNNNAWVSLQPMPTARAYGAAIVFDNKVYVMGGEASGVALTTNEVFDPSGPGIWTQATPLPFARSRFGASAGSSHIVLLGGPDNPEPLRYNVRASIWETIKPPALPLGIQPAMTTRDAAIFVAAGDANKSTSAFYELQQNFVVTINLP